MPPDLEGSVITLGKERGYGRTRRTVRYLSTVARLAVTRRANALVAHMCPVYLVAAAPITKLTRMRTALWFVHPADTPMLRVAERLADVVVTALPGSYPAARPKWCRSVTRSTPTASSSWASVAVPASRSASSRSGGPRR